ncbi:hypothetical protein FisN_7Lh356 [Fistulifera solaris]|uniref:Chitin-binding type-2 domain-containing protein n=1 Tax=Fistulifera solaris TaxID=1519565 RepID=A0A1Z5JB87_FISSO|nr:hypothetical protein FisN_7Lh356 [Fistulifera solaris]|eukprot:GAX11260.1 hypothetical protein FisN_7Lh356 [Fistulifera solaris]
MKSFSFILPALAAMASSPLTAATDDKPHLSAVGPARDLGIVLENCETYLSCGFNDDEYRVCYYGIPYISEPQEICWRNTPIRNAVANSLRILGRLECGFC